MGWAGRAVEVAFGVFGFGFVGLLGILGVWRALHETLHTIRTIVNYPSGIVSVLRPRYIYATRNVYYQYFYRLFSFSEFSRHGHPGSYLTRAPSGSSATQRASFHRTLRSSKASFKESPQRATRFLYTAAYMAKLPAFSSELWSSAGTT